MTDFPAAPLDLISRGATLLVWSLVLMGAALALAALVRGDGWPLAAGAAIALGIGLVAVVGRAVQPVAYAVGPDGLVVRRRHARPRRYGGPVRVVSERRPFHVKDFRLLGSGGLYGYTGRFSLHGLGRARVHVTHPAHGVVVDAGGRLVQVSPRDVRGFVAAAGGEEALDGPG